MRTSRRIVKDTISRERYFELMYFCKQYSEKKEMLKSFTGIKAVNSDGMPRGNSVGNPTEQQALLKYSLEYDINLIEQTVKEVAPEIYEALLLNVTEGINYTYLDIY